MVFEFIILEEMTKWKSIVGKEKKSKDLEPGGPPMFRGWRRGRMNKRN